MIPQKTICSRLKMKYLMILCKNTKYTKTFNLANNLPQVLMAMTTQSRESTGFPVSFYKCWSLFNFHLI